MRTKAIEKKILLELVKDGRQSISQISRKVGATRQTVAKKIEQLKNAGLIGTFKAKLNPEKFGLSTRAYVFLREDPTADLRRRNEQAIRQLHRVSGFHRLFGRYSAILEVWTKDKEELTALVKKIHKLKGIRETETFIVHSTVKDSPEEPFMEFLK